MTGHVSADLSPDATSNPCIISSNIYFDTCFKAFHRQPLVELAIKKISTSA
jgi:hypothetical protein